MGAFRMSALIRGTSYTFALDPEVLLRHLDQLQLFLERFTDLRSRLIFILV